MLSDDICSPPDRLPPNEAGAAGGLGAGEGDAVGTGGGLGAGGLGAGEAFGGIGNCFVLPDRPGAVGGLGTGFGGFTLRKVVLG